MGRIYSAQFRNVAVVAAQDLFSALPLANKPIQIHKISISQTTEVADAAEEMLTIGLTKGNTTVGSGGSAPAAVAYNINTPAAGVTFRANDTTEISAGTAVQLETEDWNIRMPYIYHPAPEDRITIANALLFAVQLITVPADSITMSGTIVVEELA